MSMEQFIGIVCLMIARVSFGYQIGKDMNDKQK